MAKVNVFTCAHNAEKTIARTIESVLSQTYQDFIYIITDNGSTDGTLDIIEKYAMISNDKIKVCQLFRNDIRHYTSIMVLSNKLTFGMNTYFTHVDADDEMHPEFLEKTVAFAENNDLDFVGAGYEKIDGASGCVLNRRGLKEDIMINGPEDLKESFIDYRGLTTFSWAKLFKIRENESVLSDYEMFEDSISTLKYLQEAERAGFLKDILFKYHVYKDSYSYQKVDLAVKNYELLYYRTREFIESFGELSPINNDFLYAIYISIMQDTIDWIIISETPAERKLLWSLEILSKPLLSEIFALRAFSPEIKNLRERNAILNNIAKKLAEVPDSELIFSKIQEKIEVLKCLTI